MRIRTTLALGAALAATTVATLRTALADEARAASTPNVVTVRAGDYFFEAPASIPAGLTTFRLATTGKEMHHVTIFRLAEGHRVAELVEALKSPHAPVPAWAVAVGGPNAPAPGGTFDATVELQPGSYALVCLIPSSDGAPHVMKGMVRPLTVTATTGSREAGPRADVTMRLADYTFEMSGPVNAGRRTLRVENAASQPHEVEIVRLAPGTSAHDFLSWAEKMQGPPPGLPIGGVTFLSPRQVNYIDVDFAPGRYALLCFVPDAKDGKPHFVHGMVKEIEIR